MEPREWGLNPRFWESTRFLVRDVKHLIQPLFFTEDCFVVNGNALYKVEVFGHLLEIDPRSSFISLLVSDGTGFFFIHRVRVHLPHL